MTTLALTCGVLEQSENNNKDKTNHKSIVSFFIVSRQRYELHSTIKPLQESSHLSTISPHFPHNSNPPVTKNQTASIPTQAPTPPKNVSRTPTRSPPIPERPTQDGRNVHAGAKIRAGDPLRVLSSPQRTNRPNLPASARHPLPQRAIYPTAGRGRHAHHDALEALVARHNHRANHLRPAEAARDGAVCGAADQHHGRGDGEIPALQNLLCPGTVCQGFGAVFKG